MNQTAHQLLIHCLWHIYFMFDWLTVIIECPVNPQCHMIVDIITMASQPWMSHQGEAQVMKSHVKSFSLFISLNTSCLKRIEKKWSWISWEVRKETTCKFKHLCRGDHIFSVCTIPMLGLSVRTWGRVGGVLWNQNGNTTKAEFFEDGKGCKPIFWPTPGIQG